MTGLQSASGLTVYVGKTVLYRWVDESRQSFGGFQWGGVGSINIAHDFSSNPGLSCGSGLHGLLPLDEGQAWELIPINEGGYLQEVMATMCILSRTGRKYRFHKGEVLREWPMPSISAFYHLRGAAKFRAGEDWPGLTDFAKRQALANFTGVFARLAQDRWTYDKP